MEPQPESPGDKGSPAPEVITPSPVAEGRLQVLQIYKLLQLVRKGMKPQIEKMINLGVPNLINLTEPGGGLSALHMASATNNVDMVEFLLALGADHNIRDKKGCTPTKLAEELHHDNVVAALAKIQPDGTGEAAQSEQESAVQPPSTPATTATGKGRGNFPLPICSLPPELTPLRKDTGLPHFLIEYYQPYTDHKRFDQDRPPRHPMEDDSPWYISEPAKIYRNINHCVREGDYESLCLAFSQNIPVDVKDRLYKTPLMIACSTGSLQMAQFLINLGADVNACDQFKWTPLHHACHAGNVDIVQLLVQSGASIEGATLSESTPLIRAIKSSNASCVEFLLNNGANPCATTKQDQSCMDIAKLFGNEKIMEIVRDKFEKQQGPKDKKKGKPPQQMPQVQPTQTSDLTPKSTLKEHIISVNPITTTTTITTTTDDEPSIYFAPKTVWGTKIASTAQLTDRATVRKMSHSVANLHKGPPKMS